MYHDLSLVFLLIAQFWTTIGCWTLTISELKKLADGAWGDNAKWRFMNEIRNRKK